MAGLTEETARDLLEALNELRRDLRRVEHNGISVRLVEAEREAIAHRIFEHLDARLAPADAVADAADDVPRRRQAKFRK